MIANDGEIMAHLAGGQARASETRDPFPGPDPRHDRQGVVAGRAFTSAIRPGSRGFVNVDQRDNRPRLFDDGPARRGETAFSPAPPFLLMAVVMGWAMCL
jgi:hypothetical protein